MSKSLTREEALALMASGVPLDEAEAEATEGVETTEANAEVEETQEVEVEETKAPEAPAAESADHTNTLLEMAKTNAKLEAKIESLEAQLSEQTAASENAKSVIRTATERLGIGLGATVVGLENLSLSGLCTQFNSLNAKFEERFSTGATSRVQSKPDDTISFSNEVRRRIAASKID